MVPIEDPPTQAAERCPAVSMVRCGCEWVSCLASLIGRRSSQAGSFG